MENKEYTVKVYNKIHLPSTFSKALIMSDYVLMYICQ